MLCLNYRVDVTHCTVFHLLPSHGSMCCAYCKLPIKTCHGFPIFVMILLKHLTFTSEYSKLKASQSWTGVLKCTEVDVERRDMFTVVLSCRLWVDTFRKIPQKGLRKSKFQDVKLEQVYQRKCCASDFNLSQSTVRGQYWIQIFYFYAFIVQKISYALNKVFH